MTNKSDATGTSTIWGGRFSEAPDRLMEEINASIDVDKRLYKEDVAGSKAHARMLADCGILTTEDRDAILAGLDRVEKEIAADALPLEAALEDIHMNIETRLKTLVGEAAGRLHTARSRNDQVATDFRLHIRAGLDDMMQTIRAFQKSLITKADNYSGTVMPGFTHLQTAQPVTFGHHLLAYVEMLNRDYGRLQDARARMNECPLGAAALAGTSFPINRHQTATELGFDAPMANSLDAVSDRDFALESLSACSILSMHLSRLAEEIVIWMSAPFGFVQLPDKFTTGSSIMPQKRNPDAAELVRAKTGRIFSGLFALLTVMKGLPLTYQKDMQEDKELTFLALDATSLCIAAMNGMVSEMTANEPAMRKAAAGGFSTATDLADWLVRAGGIPFRDAHHITGRIVAAAEAKNCDISELPLATMQEIEPRITADIFSVLSVEASVSSRISYGGTSPDRVREQISKWKEKLA